jgi:hypothetical protein
VVEKTLLRAAATGLASVRLFPAGRRAVLAGRGEAGTSELLSFPLRYRRVLLDALEDLAGMKDPPGAVSETVFQLESTAGITAFRLSFVQGLSGPEAIVKVLPDRKAALTLDFVGLNREQVEITRKVLSKGGGCCILSSPGPEGVATTLFALQREIHRPETRVVAVEEQFRRRSEGFIQLERRDVAKRFAGKWTRLAESLEPDVLLIELLPDPADFPDLVHLAQGGTTVLCGIRRFNFDRTLRTLLSMDVDPSGRWGRGTARSWSGSSRRLRSTCPPAAGDAGKKGIPERWRLWISCPSRRPWRTWCHPTGISRKSWYCCFRRISTPRFPPFRTCSAGGW